MDLKTFNDLFREYRLAALEERDGGSLQRKLDAELAVLRAAGELAEGQLGAKLQGIETTILGVREEARELYAELSELNGQLNSEYNDGPLKPNQGSLIAALKKMLHYYAPGAEVSAERNGEDSLHSAVRNARLAVREAEAAPPVTSEDILAAVDAEEELPGDMPEDLWENIRRMDKAQMTEFLRGGVRDTKAGIRRRLQTLLNHG